MNKLHFCYNSIERVEQLAAPSSIFIPGRSNRNDVAFQAAREKGAEVYAYFNLVERNITRVSSLDDAFYMGDRVSAPLWGGGHMGYKDKTLLLDIRVGSEWIKFAVEYLRDVVRSRMFDGVFLDVIGGQLHMSDYKNWPTGERQEWSAGAVDTVRLLDEMRRAEDERFVLVNNNHWNQAPNGEAYVNGICIEHPQPSNSEALRPFAARPYGKAAGRRRVLVIAQDDQRVAEWGIVPGVTHIAQSNGLGYGAAQDVPGVVSKDLRLTEALTYCDILKGRTLGLVAAAQDAEKRVSELAHRQGVLVNQLAACGEVSADRLARMRAGAAACQQAIEELQP